jgi:hypothetical protein
MDLQTQDFFLSFNKEFKFKFCVKQYFAKSPAYCRSPESLAKVMSCVEDVVASVSSDMVCSSVRNLSSRAELSVFRTFPGRFGKGKNEIVINVMNVKNWMVLFKLPYLSRLCSDFRYVNCIVNRKRRSLRFITSKSANSEEKVRF